MFLYPLCIVLCYSMMNVHARVGVRENPDTRLLSTPAYLGCFKDTPDRALPVRKRSGTVAQCVANCSGFRYVGRQWTGECWCGNEGYDKHGISEGCNCEGSNVGGWKNCVWDMAPTTTVAPTATPTVVEIDTAPAYLGCFKDAGDRALPVRKSSGTIAQCVANCSGFRYIGRQWTGECWCGNEGYDKHGISVGSLVFRFLCCCYLNINC